MSIYETCMKKLKEKCANLEINAQTIITVLRFAMEIVETTQLKGAAQKTLVEKLVRQVIVDAPISDDKEKLLLDMVDNGIIGSTADLVVSATNGELNINAAISTAAVCCKSCF